VTSRPSRAVRPRGPAAAPAAPAAADATARPARRRPASDRRARRALLLPAALAGALALAACATGSAADADADASTAATGATGDGHGYVEGAVELQEPQLRLVALSADGALTAFDPATEESVVLADGVEATRLVTDGRYVAASADDGSVTLVDGGAWTVPHGDHSHYYLADPRVVAEPGDLDGGAGAGEARVASSASLTAVSFDGSGRGVVLDGEALADGERDELGRVDDLGAEGVLVPLGGAVVASVATGDAGEGVADAVQVVTPQGDPVDGARASCPGLRGASATRVGVVVGCSDGALLVTEGEADAGPGGSSGEGEGAGNASSGSDTADASDASDGAPAVTIERIPYPEGTAPADVATSFEQRPGRPALAAVAGTRGAWLLDARARSWTLVETPEPLLRATAVGDADDTVVGVDASGRVVVLSPDGLVAQTEPLLAGDLVDGALPAGVRLEVDASRSYVASPATGQVHEIDHADAARVARSFDLPATLLVETGR